MSDESLRRAFRNLVENARAVQLRPPYTEYIIDADTLTVLGLVINDECSYEEAKNG